MNEIEIRKRDLSHTPGWTALSDTKKKWLQNQDAKIDQFVQAKGIADMGICMVLIETENGLEGEKMSFRKDYLENKFTQSAPAAYKVMSDMRELLKVMPKEAAEILAMQGELLLSGSARVGIKRITQAAKEITWKAKDPEALKKTIAGPLREKLREIRAAHRSGKVIKLSQDEAIKVMLSSCRRTIKSIKGMTDTKSRKQVIETLAGYLLESFGVPQAIAVKRTPIPEGMVAKVGYPKGKPRK